VSTTLNDLHDLGVDQVVTDPAELDIPGHDIAIELGFSSDPGVSDPGADLLAFLQTFPAHTRSSKTARRRVRPTRMYRS